MGANVLLGWTSGYSFASTYLLFWLMLGLAASAGWRMARAVHPSTELPDVCVRAATLGVAIVTILAMVTGALGRFTMSAMLTGQVAIWAAVFAFTPRREALPDARLQTHSWPSAAVAIGASLLAFAVAYSLWYAPLTLYDSVSYHLHFAARWVQDRAVTIIATPFSDEAQAYAPGNGELLLAWLMLPFHGDLVARVGQLPFALLGALALFALARRLGRPASRAIYPATFFLLARPVAEQMIGANVDIICAAWFLISIYFAMVAVDGDRAIDWAVFGLSAGLYFGTKYVALVYAPVLLLMAFAKGWRRRALWAMPGILVFGFSWYLRNWIVAGSPIYPASLAIGGLTLATGAFSRTAMLNTIFHTTELRLLPVVVAHLFGPALLLVWLPFAVAGWIVMARQGWWPAGVLAAIPLLMAPLHWFGFPVNIDSRFLLPALGPALIPFAFVFSSNRWWNRCVHLLYAGAMAWLVVGVHRSLPASLPWFMSGYLLLDGLIRPQFLAWFAALALAMAALWTVVRRWPRIALPALVASMACSTAVLAVGARRWCGDAPCAYVDTTSPFIRPNYLESWRWIDEHVSGATVAYTGINLPYPLTGPKLTNRVVYANIDGRAHWRFHDFDRLYRAGRLVQTPPVLAMSSGELMPVADRTGPRPDAARPRYERIHGNRDEWLFNLEALEATVLYVAQLSAYEIDYVWHNERGFPIEDEWARSDPRRFQLIYENLQVHIYAIDPGARIRG